MAGASLTHPEFADERRHLAATLTAIARAVEAPLKLSMGDEAAGLAMEAHRAWRRIQLREALDSPYFARLEFVAEGSASTGRPEVYYVGKTYFEGDGISVTGWQAPVAALFYRSTSARASYVAPAGEIRGRLKLKRRLVVDHGTLRLLADDLDERSPGARPRPAPAAATRLGDELLRSALSAGASPWLHDIIATIQAPQYALITAPPQQVLVVQGVAGSGKTSIALHRLSYLVYPALAAGQIPPRCIVFGPNRLFLGYVSAVLPKLGLHHATQTTIAEWALQRMGQPHLRLADATFDALLDPSLPQARKDTLYQRSRLKTSRRLGTLLERYVAWRRDRIDVPADGWLVRQTLREGSRVQQVDRRLPAELLRAWHQRLADRPFAVHRAAFGERVLTHVVGSYEAHGQADAEAQLALGRRRLKQAADLRAEVRRLRAAPLSTPPARVPFGAAPVFGVAPLPRASAPRQPAGAGGVVGGVAGRKESSATSAALGQTLQQLERAAERRQQEGEQLVRDAEAALASLLSPEAQELARRGARDSVAHLVDVHWPGIAPLRDYYALLADGALLQALSEGLFDAGEVALLAGEAPRLGGVVDLSDLPAIHYLFVLSQGPEVVGRIGHDYVVVDEAQDVSELDLCCLRRLEHRQSFTLLGDLAQSIHSHRGISSWAQVAAIFAGAPYTYEECTVSYRTTAEITGLANRVLRSLARALSPSVPSSGRGDSQRASSRQAFPSDLGEAGEGQGERSAREAEAFERHGPPPSLEQVPDEAALVPAISRAVAVAQRRGCRNVAIIAKTPARARDLASRLETVHAVRDLALIDRPDVEYRGGVAVLPVALAKGLEFDASVVVDAGAETYGPAAFDGRLLYVALTRALHEVHVLWQGDLTPHLHP